MFNLAIDTALSRGLLRELVDDTEAEIDKHQQAIPGYTATAAGRDFGDHGVALDRIFTALHARNLELMRRTAAVGTAAHTEVTTVADADGTSSRELGSVSGLIAGR
ncbi:hypothetical protein CKALI_09860 [Corynebacterium kalinowskii]|uniref:Uncharacterized protein n=1 Tax=Corynebacterium kalinowskii TaxID=2675216 RepID=A0A6B8VT48_9CORY|nr:hypothetical protein [Corynebacterium kalinowskii]QGU02827.1 hypothetical protein CKALI_09860 [Corynebacterium kalinowskii]